jgi:hypothetical protein
MRSILWTIWSTQISHESLGAYGQPGSLGELGKVLSGNFVCGDFHQFADGLT